MVVMAILSVLTAIVVVGVTGLATTGRATTRISDIRNVQDAVKRFSGEHSRGYFPVAAGAFLDSDGDGIGDLYGGAGEAPPGGSTFDAILVLEDATQLRLRTIDWESTFTTEKTRFFVPEFLSEEPLQSRAFLADGASGNGSPTAYLVADGILVIPDRGRVGVWTIDEVGKVRALLDASRYTTGAFAPLSVSDVVPDVSLAPVTATPTPKPSPTPVPTPSPTPTSPPELTTLEVRVTDAPPPSVTQLLVTIRDIQIHKSPIETEAAWVTVVPGDRAVDLVAVTGIEQLLGSVLVEPGRYNHVRFELVEARITIDGVERTALFPPGKHHLSGGFNVVPGQTTVLTLDFDGEKSLFLPQQANPVLAPFVDVLVRERGQPLASARKVPRAPMPSPPPFSPFAFFDSFEDGAINPFWTVTQGLGTVALSSEQAHSGSQSLKMTSTSASGQRNLALSHAFAESLKGSVSAWLYDTAPGSGTLSAALSLSNTTVSPGEPESRFALLVQEGDGSWYNATIAGGPSQYGGFPGDIQTPVARTLGWHQLKAVFDSADVRLFIDDIYVASLPGDHVFNQISLSVYGPPGRPNASYYWDDLLVQGVPAAILVSPTPTPVPPTATPVPTATGWVFKAAMPQAGHGASIGVSDGKIDLAHLYNGQQSNHYRYDPGTNTWLANPAFPPDVGNGKGSAVVFSASANSDVLYEIGGTNCCVGISTVYAYTFSTNSWTTVASQPVGQDGPATGVIDGKIYVAGGYGGGTQRDILQVYDPATNVWSTKASMSIVRGHAAGAVVNGLFYVIGGKSGSSTVTSGEVYNPVTDTWSPIAAMSTPRNEVTAAVVNNRIYVIGGNNNNTTYYATVESYDPASNTWRPEPSMSTARSQARAAVVGGVIYVFGGYNFDGSVLELSSVEAFTPTPPVPTATGTPTTI